jgi:DNA-binding XRE family transcriptional regulator
MWYNFGVRANLQVKRNVAAQRPYGAANYRRDRVGSSPIPPRYDTGNHTEEKAGMRKKEFAEIRRHFGKTQSQMAQILGVSPKAIQSFEQGWRNVPVHIERLLLLILALKRNASRKNEPCWLTRRCPVERRQDCPAWQFDAGHLCWFINGTICEGTPQESWKKKMRICRECEVYQSILPL